MSVLDTPRIYFRGLITWDPIVTNNDRQHYDVEASRTVFGTGDVATYRERARLAVLDDLNTHNWNVHGTHRSAFFDTEVTGVDLGEGFRDDDAALQGVPVSFRGMLVDVDPHGMFTSQLFFDTFSCGIQGGPSIHACGFGPMVARRMNGGRNCDYTFRAGLASAVWQASFATGRLSVQPRGSAALSALQCRLGDEGVAGITVRLNTYRTAYYDTESPAHHHQQNLADRIARGGFHPNPARSRMVGVIGLWREGEAPSVPGDRVLAPVGNGPVGTAFARLHDGGLSIDLSSSVPEVGFDGPKLDLGPLTVAARTGAGYVTLGTLGYTDYAAAAYQATSGIVSLPLEGAGVAGAGGADLEVRAANGTVLLAEQLLTVVADPPNVYLEEGEEATVSLRAFRRGQRPGTPVSVSVVEVGGPLAPVQVVTDEDGLATLPLHGGRGGAWTWMLLPWTGEAPPPPSALDPRVHEYLTLRTAPADQDVGELEPTWEQVYHHVLRHWEAQAPCMDNWLRLGDEEQCRAYAGLLRRLTSRSRFNRYRYMPVTRDLTPGQRRLLHRWCALVLAEEPANPHA
ncbi:MAG: hypothetical protein ACRD0C_01325 [Acidimicrobiia bacterium]